MDLIHPSAQLIIATCRMAGLLRNQVAYVLATAWHESGRYRYMREIWGPTPAQLRYEGRKDLGNTRKGDGKKFMGRGFCQITGRRNYQDWSRRLGLDLVKEPQLAEKPDIAARILVEGMKLGTFTGKRLSDYITLSKSNFTGARRIINGQDKARMIASYAGEFDRLLKALPLPPEKAVERPQPVPGPETAPKVPKPTPAPAPTPETILLPSSDVPVVIITENQTAEVSKVKPPASKQTGLYAIAALVTTAVVAGWQQISIWVGGLF